MKTFVIKYGVYSAPTSYRSGEIKVKNCHNSVHAQIKLEQYLKSKDPRFTKLVVHSCREDLDILNIFNDIFYGGKK